MQSVDLSRRGGGVLLHVSSLPGRYGIGDLGPAAHRWIDLLAGAGQRWWQILPLGYAGDDGSPYRCYSAFASNPLLISPEGLLEDGLVTRSDLKNCLMPAGPVNYQRVRRNKLSLLKIAHETFQHGARRLADSFHEFIDQEKGWLEDFSDFMALKEVRGHHANAIDFHRFSQFIFSRQLKKLRKHAKAAGIFLIGDLPIFVSPESADVWTHPKLFQLDKNLRPRAVAGVPPDMFSTTGQRWGNPVYNWKEMAKDNFAWWKLRLDATFKQADLVRIDHFRGLESYWRIPAECPTAERGKWVKVPGVKFFEAMLKGNPQLPLLAEDLGVITPAVEQLRDQFHLPGMRVLQFGITGDPENPHAPHNYIHHCFAYTGTHDNDTVRGWYKSLSRPEKRQAIYYLPDLETDPAWSMIRALWASVAGQAIVPMQDLLALGSSARMNTPGKSHGNWKWRLADFTSCKEPLGRLRDLTKIYDRQPSAVSA